MARITRSNLAFYVVSLACALGAFLLWYLLNPNSPRLERSLYDVLFEEVGTLGVGDPVQYCGLRAGEVRALSLDPATGLVRARIGVLKSIAIPEDSRIRVINEGLVGSRVVDVMPGKSESILAPGSLVMGGYDPGATRLVTTARLAVLEADTLAGRLADIARETLGPKERARYAALLRRLAGQFSRLGGLAAEGKAEASESLERFRTLAEKLDKVAEETAPARASLAENAAKTGEAAEALRGKLGALEARIAALSGRLERAEVSSLVGLVENPEFKELLKNVSADAETLLKELGGET